MSNYVSASCWCAQALQAGRDAGIVICFPKPACYKSRDNSNKAALAQSNSFQALQDPPHALISILRVLRCGMRHGLVQGAVNSVPWKSTAYAQRGMLYNMQYYVAWNSSSLQSSSLAWINGLQVPP